MVHAKALSPNGPHNAGTRGPHRVRAFNADDVHLAPSDNHYANVVITR